MFDPEDFRRDQERKDPVVKADLTGKVVIVTGSNTGIGYEVAKHFAQMNPKRLILACRSEPRGQAALERLQRETGFKAAELWLLDQSKFASVQAFATKFNSEVDRLDILVENAALASNSYNTTEDGWEENLQVNNLGPELLTLLLLPSLFKTRETYKVNPRIVIVSSDVHLTASIPEDIIRDATNLHKETSSKSYRETKPMNQSGYLLYKLYNVLFLQALHKHLPPSSIVVNGVNPGYCESELRRHATEEQKPHFAEFDKMAYTGEEGARHVVWGALAREGEQDMFGAYTSVSEVRKSSDFVRSDVGALAEKKLWNETLQILGEVDKQVPEIVSKYLV